MSNNVDGDRQMVERTKPWVTHAGNGAMIATESHAVLVPYEDLASVVHALTKMLQEWTKGQPANTVSGRRGMAP